jgi:hypothetical protein
MGAGRSLTYGMGGSHPCGMGDLHRIVAFHHGPNTVHLPIGSGIQGRRTPGHNDLNVRVLPPYSANVPAGIGIGLVGDRTGIDHAHVGFRHGLDPLGAEGLQLLPHTFRIVLVGFAAEGLEEDAQFHSPW